MTYSGFEAAPADFAAAAPRFAQAADALSAALDRTVGELEDHGPFWAGDAQFEHGYLTDWRDAADLAAECEQTLRAMAEQLAQASRAYQRTDVACAESFEGLVVELEAVLDDAFGGTGRAVPAARPDARIGQSGGRR
jgi:uncharacterized protein YukE